MNTRSTIFCLSLVSLLAVMLFASAPPATAAEPVAAQKLDLTALEHVPVYHKGRIMPWQTLARTISEEITGREKPRVHLAAEVDAKRLEHPNLVSARQLIPEGERKFDASEALLSWLVEPAAWEHVPFILAEHDDLRDLLELPHDNAENVKLRYASPYQIQEALVPGAKLHTVLGGIQKKQSAVMGTGGELQLTSLESNASDLWKRYALYRQLTSRPDEMSVGGGSLLAHTTASMEAWQALFDEFRKLGELGAMFGVGEIMQATEEARVEIAKQLQTGHPSLAELEPHVLQYAKGAERMADLFGRQKSRIFENAPELGDLSQEESERRLNLFKGMLTKMASDSQTMAIHANEMRIALYDDSDPIRVVPALNAAALDRERDTSVDAEPWMSLKMLMYGSDAVLAEYPSESVAAARTAWRNLAAAYTNRSSATRPEAFAEASGQFAKQLRGLGVAINAERDGLEIEHRDDKVLAYTAYPPPGATNNEVRYNELDPFLWTWVISLLSLACFALAFGTLRKPMFAAGMGLMLFCIGWAIYGFALRVSVTEWAPVTNMFETVIYVPLFVMILGAWFLTTPITWKGLAAGWRLSALPFGWEASELRPEQTKLMPADLWQIFGAAMIPVRIALMGGLLYLLTYAGVYDGGGPVFSLTPATPLGQFLTTPNDVVVYLVGLTCVLTSVWFGPRVVIAAVAAVPFIPMTLRGSRTRREATAEMFDRKGFALAAVGVGAFLFLVAWYASSMTVTTGTRVLNEDFAPLQPVLRSNFWLTIHVLTIVSSYGAGLLAWALGLISLSYYLFGKYEQPSEPKNLPPGHVPAVGPHAYRVPPKPPAETATLAGYSYKAMQVAVLLLAAGTILGGLWADVSWGRFWGWDPKEVFALVSLLIYLVVLHGRYAGWTGNFGTAVGSNVGAWAIIFSWYGVNFVLGVGLHAYGFGAGGQWQVGLFVFFNMLYVAGATVRYLLEMRETEQIVPAELAEQPVEAV